MNKINKRDFGSLPSGEAIHLYTLRNASGLEVAITNYGGRIVSIQTPDREGKLADIVLGFDDLAGYTGKNPYFGAIVGRYANRIANAEFRLDGVRYKLSRNNGSSSLHGGAVGFDRKVWDAKEISSSGGPALELTYRSQDGEEGYPGTLNVTVVYSLSDDNQLRIDFEGTTDRSTVLNLTNHSYFNLSGNAGSRIEDHVATIHAAEFTPVSQDVVPTGELRSVADTPFDFRKPTPIGARINAADQQLQYGEGYDHNFVLNRTGGTALAAHVIHPGSGRVLEVLTTQPGVQFYTGNHLDGNVKGKGGAVYGPRSAFCLETQHFPNSPNQPNFPTTELKPGERYHETTIFKFSVAR